MSRDLSKIPTAELQAEYDVNATTIRELRTKQAVLNEELSKRSNAIAMLRNAVMTGQKHALRIAGVSSELISAAEDWVEAERARKKERRAHREAVTP